VGNKAGQTTAPPTGKATAGRPKAPRTGRVHMGNGLYLQRGESGSASWLLRYERNGRERWMGLGPKSVFTTKQARARARVAQQQLYDGIDPLQARREKRALKALQDARTVTFQRAAEQYYEQNSPKWTSAKHREAFVNTLAQHAYKIIGALPVADITSEHVLRVVEPIWLTKNKTASRVRGRIEAVLDWAKVRNYRDGDNPARWTGFLDQVLPSGGQVGKVEHHAALPYNDVASFVTQLAERPGTGPKALEFLILTACRTSEVTKARWNEFDLGQKFWTIPADRMKARKPHRVPLTTRMLKLLKALPREGGNDSLVFVGIKANKPLNKMVLPKLVESMGHDTTVHGFRATFRTWAAEQTSYPREIIEQCLAHATGTAVELSYQRSDVLEKRRQLMEAWSTFVGTRRSKWRTGTVTPIRKGGV
jgi:integrase